MQIKQNGQSLLELAISLGLILIIITILTVTTITGLKNSQFAKNQTLASSYSQQGIELVKAVKQRNCGLTITTPSPAGPFYWSDAAATNLVWSAATNPIPEQASPLVFQINTAIPNCIFQNATTTNGESLGTIFNRKIQLERLSTNQNVIRVTVTVTWDDFSGSHNSKNVSLITNY